uniref:Transcription factor E2F8 n=1 Tax=Pogona vitticeps TaxID=103695 RepID=A0A6J0SXV7_9SAUR
MSTEDKENQPFEADENTVKTPLKQKTASHWLLTEIQPAASDHRTTPPKPTELSPGDPWTPTANLKILISAASPEIRNREQEKKLPDSRNERLEDCLSADDYEKSQPSRKDKSLGLLCHKFLARYPSYPNTSKNNEICLDEVAEELNVERRRIYDIMNVLESLHMVSRLAKNKYSWHGRHNLKKTLWILKKVAEENKYAHQVELIKKRESEQDSEEGIQKIDLVAKHIRPNDHTDVCFVELPGIEFRGASVNSHKDKSLRVMSQKFVMLFLVSTPEAVSLEIAAKILIGEDPVDYLDKSKFKTKIRRLYDIANVLSSLELIKKVHLTEEKGRKPAFKWTGPNVFSDTQGTKPEPMLAVTVSSHTVEANLSREHCSKNLFPTGNKKGFTRHSSLIKVAKATQSGWRKIHSAPSSPIKKNTSQIPPMIPSKMAQLAAVCKQQLDEHSRDFKKLEMQLEESTLRCCPTSPPESNLKPKPLLLSSQSKSRPLIPSSVSPGVLPPVHSEVSYALFVQPSQTGIVTTYNPQCSVQPVPCANVIGMKCPLGPSLQSSPGEMLTGDSDYSFGEGSLCARNQNLLTDTEQEGTKDDLASKKCFKRCKSLLKDTPFKKCKSEEMELQDVLLGESVRNKNHQSSVALHLDQEVLTSSVMKQSQSENANQHLECQHKQKEQRSILQGDKVTTSQEISVAFPDTTQKTWFPSGYLIPLPPCAHLLSESTLSNNGKAEINADKKSSGSPIAGGIPVTSDFTAVNLPALHVTPLSVLLPSSSVGAVSVVNGTAVALAHTNPVQAPSHSVMNFTLQHIRLIPTSIQTPIEQVLGSAPVCQGTERVNSTPLHICLKQRGSLQNISPNYNQELNGNSVLATPSQPTTVPVDSSDSAKGDKNLFQSSCESAIMCGFCSSSCKSDKL